MRARWLALALVGACSGARPRSPSTGAVTPPVVVERERPSRGAWTRVAPTRRPARIDGVAALADGSFVILSGSEVSRVTARGEVTAACAMDANLVVHGLHAAGTRWWVLAGEAFDPAVFRGDLDAPGCVREALPALVARDSPPGQLRATQVDADAIVWSSAGPMVRSRDHGHTWQRIPSLPEVVAVTVSGATLYAAALIGGPASRSRFERHGYEVFTLAGTQTRWERSSTPGDRAAPVALLPRENGGVIGLDALGGFEITAQGDGVVGRSAGPHFSRDRPRLLVPATRESAVGLSDGMLFEHRLTGWRPLPTLPDGRSPTRFDGAPDGSVVLADGHELWRARVGGRAEAILRSPLEGGRPTRLAVAGPVIAALSDRDRLSVSRDGGETWTTSAVPSEAGSARSLTLLPDGTVAVIAAGPSGAAVGDAPVGAIWLSDPGPHRIELPRGARVFESGASLRAVGDRWILAAGDVFVSDDQGVRWRNTLGAPVGQGEGWGVVALTTSAGRTAFALDNTGALWRSDDAGDEFVVVAPGRRFENGATARPPPAYATPQATSDWLHWDGGGALLASAGRQLFRFDREGHGGPVAALRGAVFGAAVEGGAIIAIQAPASLTSECGRDGELVLLAVSAGGALAAVPGACAHLGVAFAVDGDALYVADADGTIERASLRALWRDAVAAEAP